MIYASAVSSFFLSVQEAGLAAGVVDLQLGERLQIRRLLRRCAPQGEVSDPLDFRRLWADIREATRGFAVSCTRRA